MTQPFDETASRNDPKPLLKGDDLKATMITHAQAAELPATTAEEVGSANPNGWPTIAGFEIESELARGGMGVIYKARQTGLNRTVALKMILNTSQATPAALVRFLNEAEAVAKIEHPNIVQIYQTGNVGNDPYFALEFIDGGTLQDRIRDNPLESREAARIVELLARAMIVSHEKGIIHRDLKPLNVLMTKDGVPKITDFGLAKRLEAGDGLTRTGAILGTPSYMSPEQARGETDSITAATDIHALGAILYSLVTGRPPFVGASSHATMQQVIQTDPVSPRELQTEIPRDLETICLKCLRKDPKDRYVSAQDLADDLRAFQEERSISARPMSRLEKSGKWVRKNPSWAAMIGLFVVTLVSGTVVSLFYADRANLNAKRARDAVDEEQLRSSELRQANSKLSEALSANGLLIAEATFEGLGSVQQALEYLEDIPQKERKLEWEFARRKFEGSIATFNGHLRGVTTVAYSPDGERIVSGGNYGDIIIWNAKSGTIMHRLNGHVRSVQSVCFSPNGQIIASGSEDGSIRLWEAKTGKFLQSLSQREAVESIAFSPDGFRIVAGTSNGKIRVWDHENRLVVLDLAAHKSSVNSVAFSPDAKQIASGSNDTTIGVWDAKTGKSIFQWGGHGSVKEVCFSPCGKLLACASLSDRVTLWDPRTGREIRSLSGRAECISFSPDGRYLVGGSSAIRVWDISRADAVSTMKGHTESVRSVRFSPDGERIVSGSDDQTVRIWNAKTGKNDLELKGGMILNGPRDIRFSPNGSFVTVASDASAIPVWDVRSGRLLYLLSYNDQRLDCLAFSPDSSKLATGSTQGWVVVWDLKTGNQLKTIKADSLPVCSVCFSPDGQSLASRAGFFDEARAIKIWDLFTGESKLTIECTSWPGSVVFSPDGTRIASSVGSLGESICVWNVQSGKLISELLGHSRPVVDLCFSNDGQRIFSASFDHTVRIWDLLSNRPTFELRGHSGAVSRAGLTGDDDRIVTSGDGTTRFWNTQTGRQVYCVEGDTRTAYDPNHKLLAGGSYGNWLHIRKAFEMNNQLDINAGPEQKFTRFILSPDGERLAAADSSGTIRIYDTTNLATIVEMQGSEDHFKFSPDSKLFTLANASRTKLRCLDAKTGQELYSLNSPPSFLSGWLSWYAFSGDSTQIVTGSYDDNIRIWDAKMGRLKQTFKGDVSTPNSIKFHPNGSQIAFKPDNKTTVTVWDIESGGEISKQPQWPDWAQSVSEKSEALPESPYIWRQISRNTIRRIPLVIPEDEANFRSAFIRPDPYWHRKQLNLVNQENNPFAASVQNFLLHKATAEEHFDYNRFDQAFYWSVAAQILKPKPPVIDWPEVLPKPMKVLP